MDGELEIIDGPDKGRTIPFAEGQTVVIGRGGDTATKLSDRYTSRVHCQLEVQGGTLTLTDLGGAGGTFVNGTTIQGKRTVMPGEIIGLGYTRLLIHMGPPDADRTVNIPFPARITAPTLEALPLDASKLTGTVLADYKVGALIGIGTTGIIYKGTCAADGQEVALKVFHAAFGQNQDAKKRFLRSSRTVQGLRHPHLISIYQAGEAGPFCWIAMELFEGSESLAKVIQRIGIANILDWRYGLRIAVHVARGLEFAQQHGIVHRNITPSNILYRASDRLAKLGDLMLAKTLTAEDAAAITTKGELLGDIVYMSPERVFGETEIDGRSDLYELGATVYALLTGFPPCRAKSPLEVMASLEKGDPLRPKQVQLSIPDCFEAIVLRMLAKKPAERFQTPTELLSALEQVAKTEGVGT